jgi:hypothetical protein
VAALADVLQIAKCVIGRSFVWQQVEELGLKKNNDEDLIQFVSEFLVTGAKLAGTLGDVARGESLREV